MVAIDTNVIIRLITLDDEAQLKTAEKLVGEQGAFVSNLALVEAAWVLRSRHGYDRARVAHSLRSLLQAENVQAELEDWAFWALDRFENGADMADMFLLVAGRDQPLFATFDRRLPIKAGPNAPVRVELLT